MAIGPTPDCIPTNIIIAPAGTVVAIGDIVGGIAIQPGTTVVGITTNFYNQVVITLNQPPWIGIVVPGGVFGDPCGVSPMDWFSDVNFTNPNFINRVLTFREDVKGWVSFKSFIDMEFGLSMANDYYTFKNGYIYQHDQEDVNRNTFYGDFESSSVNVLLNDNPSIIKMFNTLNYEGSQAKVDKFTFEDNLSIPLQPDTNYNDQEYYNLYAKDGWNVESIITDKEIGYVNEFVEKEGKWFNNINRLVDLSLQQADTSDFTFQGIGVTSQTSSTEDIFGCMDSKALNYNPLATIDDGSCIMEVVLGCTDQTALNYNPNATVDDGSCLFNPPPLPIYGCTDPLSSNYNQSATVDDGSCIPVVSISSWRGNPDGGCTDPGDGSGPYSTLGACIAACSEEDDGGGLIDY